MRIILADPNRKALWALKTLLDEETDMEVVGMGVNAGELLSMAKEARADLILMDGQMPDVPLEDLLVQLHGMKPNPVIVVMSAKPEIGRRALEIGADAFVSKGERPDWLIESLRHYASRSYSYKTPE